ncbi:hypothetical protein J8F10_23505 [Gemmata sp. G18]|uniref:Uncharacterized protein n=1 Tax=Gemmata palustris TaxID=2822762 RepID=A0ABS5BWZ9_9BACT|nr:hypothetical protein [Gemmata palustris]MBP3958226.1 hypothetical protein [Gemmata palustris]
MDEKPRKGLGHYKDDGDEDDWSRKKKTRSYEDDEDDRPRSKSRRRDEDEDEDDRPRKKKKRRDEDEEDEQPRSGKRAAFAKGKVAALLLSISFWLNLAAYGLLTLYALIAWVGVAAATSSSPSSRSSSGGSGGGGGAGVESALEILVVLPGLIGLGAWIVGLVGCSFAIAGPAKARGMAITSTVLSSVHLILLGVTFSNLHGGSGIGFARGLGGVGSFAWMSMVSALPSVGAFLPVLFYQSRAIGGEYIVSLLAGICEVLRLIFVLITLKGLASAARDYGAAEKAQTGVMISAFVLGGTVLGILFMTVLLAEAKFGPSTMAHLGMLMIVATLAAYTFMMLTPALAALRTRDACTRRS